MAKSDDITGTPHITETKPIAAAAPVEPDDIALVVECDFEYVPGSFRDILDAPVVAKAVTAWHEVRSKQIQLAKLQSDRAYELENRKLDQAYELENRKIELKSEQGKREHEIDLRRMDIVRGNAWAACVIAGALLLGVAGLFWL